ncbi:helix-turn-helix domain-containing protein [Trichlorobacter ammonificans]|uniref:Helix-turn-helix DNA-binding protein n=1 Tax=Trichlorobacter ammonificans TaxID=2916410 RepID=A0ABN8HL53_9BACT|nr:helix-turn-helix domain-containing protein [Trichlorobacter ammonificans]CAH2032318.1 putative Helix-turn-helix DNA-binding protein [Trichlorobacter ammonificans]
MTMTCHSDNDLLTVEEFADKLKVSRTTVFGWLKSGLLHEGTHYFRIGRVLRFVWDTGLLLHQKRKTKAAARNVHPSKPAAKKTNRVPSQPGINLEYGAGG